MFILSAIGQFFVRIWRWIKDTAWVQPLLIVGVIFAIMFSIIPIVNSIQALADDLNSSEAFYTQYRQSLENGENSDADKITDWIQTESENPTGNFSQYGEKFFLIYVSDSCSVCAEARPGFEFLRDNFNGSMKPNDTSVPFRMYTIFADEITDQTTTHKSAFVQYMERNDYFFENAAGNAYNTDYYNNGYLSDTDLQYMEQCDPENFLTPTALLVDFTNDNYGVSEVFFGSTGDDTYSKAKFLLDCWNHEGDFAYKGE